MQANAADFNTYDIPVYSNKNNTGEKKMNTNNTVVSTNANQPKHIMIAKMYSIFTFALI